MFLSIIGMKVLRIKLPEDQPICHNQQHNPHRNPHREREERHKKRELEHRRGRGLRARRWRERPKERRCELP